MRATILLLAAALAGPSLSDAQTRTPPRYEADLTWPKPLPNQWVLGGMGGTCVDAQGHVFILNRQDVLEGELNTGRLAPPIIEFDPDGNVVSGWGDPKLLDPRWPNPTRSSRTMPIPRRSISIRTRAAFCRASRAT